MPIEILDFPEPLTPRARESLGEPVLIKSKAYDQLLYELRRYCDGQTSGRSFLIAGHRGAGKTTLVLSALQNLLREVRDRPLRPLNIQLLGPSLLPGPKEKDLAEPGEGAASGKKKLTEFENILVQITLALYRAVVHEFTVAYEERMLSSAPPNWPTRAMSLEAPGQLILELDEYPGKARLREFWRRAGALPHGLLTDWQNTNIPYRRQPTRGDEGIRELVALASVSEAYRRISGTIQARTEAKSGEEAENKRTGEVDLKGKDLFGPLITVLTGGAVATGVAALKPDQIPLAALVGVLTALASAFVGKRSSSRSRRRSAATEDLFLPDLSVATLDRVLPVLLERVRAAGLAPIFVIDELDKVANLSERILDMVQRLKKLVAESAFFCFLTDRSYFEEMRARNERTPYSIEYTYFTNYLFVTFAHTDLHAYLAQVLKKPEPTVAPSASPEALRISADVNEEIADHAVLPYVLLHNAEMHPIDLRRRLNEIRAADRSVGLALGSVRSVKGSRIELLIQVAIELLLEDPAMEALLANDIAFRRLAHDALYYLSRQWKNMAEIRLDDVGRKAFCDYLVKRMKTESSNGARSKSDSVEKEKNDEKPEKKDKSGEPAGPEEPPADEEPRAEKRQTDSPSDPEVDLSSNKEQTNLLWSHVCELALLLANPRQVRERARSKSNRFAAPVLDALKVEDLGPLLKPSSGSPDAVFQWRYTRAGLPIDEPSLPPVVPDLSIAPPSEVPPGGRLPPPPGSRPTYVEQIEIIENFNRRLAQLTSDTVTFGTMGAGFGIISTSPAWPAVLEAIQRLKTKNVDYQQRGDDIFIVGQFFELLNRNLDLIADAVFISFVLGRKAAKSFETIEFAGLQVLSGTLSLKSLPEEDVRHRIDNVAKTLREALRIPEPAWPSLLSDPSLAAWQTNLEALYKQIGDSWMQLKVDSMVPDDATWDFWRANLAGSFKEPDLKTMLLAAMHKGPTRLLKIPIDEMTARDWSIAFYDAIKTKAPAGQAPKEASPPDDQSVPSWLIFVALERLGFGSRMEKTITEPPQLLARVSRARLQEDIRLNVSAAPRDVRYAVAIVSKEGTESEMWKPGKDCAALVLRQAEILTLANGPEQIRDLLFRWLEVEWLVFDWSGSAGQPIETPPNFDTEMQNARPLTGLSTKPLPVMTPIMTTLPTPWRAIGVPLSVDDLASRLRSLQA